MINNNNEQPSIYRTGDIVIGSNDPGKSVYSATGAKLIDTGVTIFGSEKDLQAQAKELSKSAIRSGGIPVQVNLPSGKTKASKAGKKKTNKPQQWADYAKEMYQQMEEMEQPVQSVKKEITLQTVQFENSFGKMKAKVENLIEHDMAFMLIFSQEEDLVFEPKVGEHLSFYTPDKYRYDVYYPGVTFDSPDSTRKFMILFKVPEENQE